MPFVDVDRLSTWTPYKPSFCKSCWAGCCRLPVEASPADMVRLGLITEDESRGSLKKHARRLISEGLVKSFRATTGLFTLSQTPAGDCVYLDPKTRFCTTYETRPDVCRKFPATLGPKLGFCPALAKSAYRP
jgi:Fe-S-cluster containining protein